MRVRIPAGAHLLGLGALLDQAIVTGVDNVMSVFLGGVIDSLGGNASITLPVDGRTHQVALVIDPMDYGGQTITAGNDDPFANPIVVAINESGGSHASLSLNGGAGASQVTVTKSSDSVDVNYDGNSAPSYTLSASLTAPSVGGSGGASEEVTFATLALASSNSEYTPEPSRSRATATCSP